MGADDRSTATPRLRFPEFRKHPNWRHQKLEDLVSTVTPPAKLQSSSYLATGKFPIIDQSQDFISGWTDNANAVISESLPLVVFGDHTCTLKFVDQPFVQGADGIKILTPKASISPKFLFQSLSYKPLAMEDYKRHFSTLKERRVFFPDIGSGEQQKIADCLMSLDEAITAQGRKVAALSAHKQGLMQQVFPREGETLPRLRFPEFRTAKEWVTQRIADLLDRVSKPVDVNAETLYQEIGVRSHGKGVFHKPQVSGAIIGNKRVFWVIPNAFVVNIVFAWEQAVAVTSKAKHGMIASHRFPMYLGKPGKCDVEFIKRAFLTPRGKHLLGLASPGGAGRNRTLGQVEFEKIEIVLPKDVIEQERIAACFSTIDIQIAAASGRLNALNNHKKALMQQLFPSQEEAI